MTELLQLVSFGPEGWGLALLTAALMTVAVAACGFLIGGVIGAFIAWGKLAGNLPVRFSADAYTTVLRGIPDLLVIYDDGFNYLTKMCLTNMREAAFRMQEYAKKRGCTTITCSSESDAAVRPESRSIIARA